MNSTFDIHTAYDEAPPKNKELSKEKVLQRLITPDVLSVCNVTEYDDCDGMVETISASEWLDKHTVIKRVLV